MKTRGVKEREKEINNKIDLITDRVEFIEKNNEWKNIEILNNLLPSIKDVLPELEEPYLRKEYLWKDYVMECNRYLKEILNKIETNIAKIEKNS